MEALEVDDISPALEVTEDFFNSFDTKLEKIVQPSEVYGVQEVPELVGHEVFDQITESRNLRNVTSLAKSNLIWDHCKNGLLETKAQTAFPAKEQRLVQRGTVADSLAWAGEGETAAFNIFNICQRRRDRPRSVNDILVQNEESSKFKPGHNRSRSDISHVNWGMVFTGTSLQQPPLPGQDNNCALLSYLALTKGEDIQGNTEHKTTFPNILKKGYLEIRRNNDSYWQSCYAELSPYKLYLYCLDSSGNQTFPTMYPLMHFQRVTVTGSIEAKVVDAALSDSSQLQLKAESPWEALDWGRKLWEAVRASVSTFTRQQEKLENVPKPDNSSDLPQTNGLVEKPMELLLSMNLTENNKEYQNVLKSGTLYRLTVQNNWKAFTFVLNRSYLMAFQPGRLDEDPLLSYNIDVCLSVQTDTQDGCDSCFQVIFPQDVLRLRAETRQRALEWMEALKAAANATRSLGQNLQVTLRNKPGGRPFGNDFRKSKRQSVTTSFLSILTTLSLERGLTVQSFKCAGCQRPIGLSNGKAKVCSYSGWYYCSTCHVDDSFLIPARLVHNWDTSKYKVSKQAKEFLEYVYEEPLIDIQQENPMLYKHAEPLATIVRLRQQLKSLRAYLFSCRAAVAEDLRRRSQNEDGNEVGNSWCPLGRQNCLQCLQVPFSEEFQMAINQDLSQRVSSPANPSLFSGRPPAVFIPRFPFGMFSALCGRWVSTAQCVAAQCRFVCVKTSSGKMVAGVSEPAPFTGVSSWRTEALASPAPIHLATTCTSGRTGPWDSQGYAKAAKGKEKVIEGKLAPFLGKVIKFATSHVYSCSLCSQKGFICEICNNGEILYPFEDISTSRCESCGAVFHSECKVKAVPCPRCVRKELQKKQKSFWRRLNMDENFEESCNMFELSYQNT